jgi:bifunctional UDP-N-acetylglucosamine pyrophosphorylase / glucosamine-1-phosphate N-acetyltransferase
VIHSFSHIVRASIGKKASVGTYARLRPGTSLGEGAYIGSGSVITKDVPDDAMAVERSPQSNREGGAARYREMKMRAKAPKEG